MKQTLLKAESVSNIRRRHKDLRHRIIDAAVSITEFWANRPHHRDDNDSHKRENDCILDEALTLFLWCAQHSVFLSERDF
jgi:hypothetical protein